MKKLNIGKLLGKIGKYLLGLVIADGASKLLDKLTNKKDENKDLPKI